MPEATDLFGHPTGPNQFSLFGDSADRLQAPSRPIVDHETRARAKLMRVLETARGARTLPWNERETRMWQTVFPQMANWLPDEEANQLRLEFTLEIERLKAA